MSEKETTPSSPEAKPRSVKCPGDELGGVMSDEHGGVIAMNIAE